MKRPSIAGGGSWCSSIRRDLTTWISMRGSTFDSPYIDEPGSQIDTILWDMGRLGQVLYPSKFLDRLETAELKKWQDQGIDMVGRLIEGTKKRGLEVFWHHRFSEVDVNTSVGRGAAWKEGPAPLKKAHPDWALKNDWWHPRAVELRRAWGAGVHRQVPAGSGRDAWRRRASDRLCTAHPLPPARPAGEMREHVTELDCA